MNIVLFETSEIGAPLPASDARAVHVLQVLRRSPGDFFDAGIINGPRGKARVEAISESGLDLSFVWGDEPPPMSPITLIIGMPRPQTARKVLFEATTLGVAAMQFVHTEKGEPGYARSHLWTTGEWRRHLIAGAQQAFCTRLPLVSWDLSLADAIARRPAAASLAALDNYEATGHVAALPIRAPLVLAIGPERGWSAQDRELLRAAGFSFAHLGERVLRTETAVVAALSLVLAAIA